MPRVVVICVATNGYEVAWRECIQSHQRYCNAHKYTYRLITSSEIPNVHPKWLKIHKMLQALHEDWDAVILLDADLYVTQRCPAIPMLKRVNVMAAKGVSNRFNSGYVRAYNTPRARQFFQDMLDFKASGQIVPKPSFVSAEGENGVFIHLSPGVVQELDKRWNNTSDPNLKDFNRHFTTTMGDYIRHQRGKNGRRERIHIRDLRTLRSQQRTKQRKALLIRTLYSR